MDFTLSEEQEMLKTSARDFLQEKCPKSLVKAMESDERGYSPELWSEMADLGWLGLVLPEQYGGSGMTFLDLAVLMEETGRACLPGPFFSTVVLGGLTVLDAGTQEQKQKYLPGIAKGQTFMTLALTEPEGLDGPEAVKVRARSSGSGFAISGPKLFVPDAHLNSVVLCVARTSTRGSVDSGISVFAVPAGAPGMSHTPLKTMTGDKLCEVAFDRVKVSRGQLIGGLNQGWPIVQKAIERATIAKCCEMVGMMARALEMTVAYAKERKQFGRPIGHFQAIQHYCANMAADVDGARFITFQAAWKISSGQAATKEVSIAKAFLNEAFGRVITLAHQVHGAIAVTIDHELQYYTKRGKSADLTYGDGEYHRTLVAQEMGL